MPRVVGVDPGTISIDVCGLDAGRPYLDLSVPTAEALADPTAFVSLLRGESPPDLIAGPSGYGLPLVAAAAATEDDLRLAFLAPPGRKAGSAACVAWRRYWPPRRCRSCTHPALSTWIRSLRTAS
jgi:Predicted butyrate kinase